MFIELNKSIIDDENSKENFQEILAEIQERDEFLCTGYVCGTDATFI